VTKATACPCGRQIEQVGRGRPRRFCDGCRPRTKPLDVTYRSHTRTCAVCRAAVDGTSKYCSEPCKWSVQKRLPCSKCGGPTGWRAGRTDLVEPTCNSCRRDYSNFEHGTRRGYSDARCRCDECVAWNREQCQAYRAKRRAEGRPIKSFGSSGPWIAPSVRLKVFERDAWTCQLCSEPLQPDSDPQSDWYPSLDHIVPQSKGGSHSAENLRAAHRWCNSIRGAEDYHADMFQEAS